MKRIVLVYEPEQVDEAAAYARANPSDILVMDFWAERECTRRGVSYTSARPFLPSHEEEDRLFERAARCAREWYRIPEMSFFAHRNVPIGESLEPNIDDYLQYVLYYRSVIGRILEELSDVTTVVVPYSHGTSAAAVASYHYNCPLDIAKELCGSNGLAFETIGAPITAYPMLHDREPLRHRLIIAAVNLLAALQPKRRRKLLAKEDWGHIKSFMAQMRDTELVLMDKSELRKVPVGSLLKHRTRFLWPSLTVSSQAYELARKNARSYEAAWKDAKPAVADMLARESGEASLWPVVSAAFDHIVCRYAFNVVLDIEGAASLLQREEIDTVLLRASVSAEYQFFDIARVAHNAGIPSIEIQHAGAVLDPRSVHSRLETSYLAAFGPLTCTEYAKRYDERRLRPIGAPRFDPYFSMQRPTDAERKKLLRERGLDPEKPVVLVVVPKEGPRLWLAPWHPTSYDVADLIDTLTQARASLPEVQFLFKFRKNGCSQEHRSYLRERFPTGGYAVSEADLFSMILVSDAVISGNSTALYESMIGGKPLVLFPWKPDAYHTPVYERIAPTLRDRTQLAPELGKIVRDGSYREARLRQQEAFLARHYSFDGRASQRMKAFLDEDLVA